MPLSAFLFDFMQIKICLATTLIRNINALKIKTNMCIFIRVNRPFQANWDRGERRNQQAKASNA
jgi:pimeloyl-CoA synthetase